MGTAQGGVAQLSNCAPCLCTSVVHQHGGREKKVKASKTYFGYLGDLSFPVRQAIELIGCKQIQIYRLLYPMTEEKKVWWFFSFGF